MQKSETSIQRSAPEAGWIVQIHRAASSDGKSLPVSQPRRTSHARWLMADDGSTGCDSAITSIDDTSLYFTGSLVGLVGNTAHGTEPYQMNDGIRKIETKTTFCHLGGVGKRLTVFFSALPYY